MTLRRTQVWLFAATATLVAPTLLATSCHEETVNPVAGAAGAAHATGGAAGAAGNDAPGTGGHGGSMRAPTGSGGGPGGGGHGGASAGQGGAGGPAATGSGTGGAGGTTPSSGGAGGAGGTPSSGGAGGAGGTPSSGGTGGGHGGVGGDPADAGDASRPDVSIPCDTAITAHPVAPSPHVPACLPIAYASNPPTSGPHYPVWAAYQTYATPVPRGFWVHSLEHGAIVITYNCSAPCDEELAALAAYLDARPADPICTAPVKARIIVTPDPELDVRFAASAWGFSLRSNCFDLGFLDPFINAHYGRGPESFCVNGIDPTGPDAGCGAPSDAGDGG